MPAFSLMSKTRPLAPFHPRRCRQYLRRKPFAAVRLSRVISRSQTLDCVIWSLFYLFKISHIDNSQKIQYDCPLNIFGFFWWEKSKGKICAVAAWLEVFIAAAGNLWLRMCDFVQFFRSMTGERMDWQHTIVNCSHLLLWWVHYRCSVCF